jgi:hypothetical protein
VAPEALAEKDMVIAEMRETNEVSMSTEAGSMAQCS